MHLKRYIALIVPLCMLTSVTAASAQLLPSLFSTRDSAEPEAGISEKPITTTRAPPRIERSIGGKKGQRERQKETQLKKVKRSVVQSVPLPVPRPWGAGDAPTEDETLAAALNDDVQETNTPQTSGKPRFLLIARRALARLSDVDGLTVAVRPEADGLAQDLMERTSARPVLLSWTKSLENLAMGEIDAVLVSVVPSTHPAPERISDAYLLCEISMDEPDREGLK